MAFLERLIPANPAFYYAMDDKFANGFPAAAVIDVSGNARNLTAPAPVPDYQNVNFNPHNNLYIYEAKNSLKSAAGAVVLKHLFTLANYQGGANFGAQYRGLFSGLDGANFGILVGLNGATKFFNNNFASLGTFKYRKSQVEYEENNQLAPIGKYELIETSLSNGWTLDGVQLGGDRDNNVRHWIGGIGTTIGFSRVLSANEIAAMNLYYDLKFGLWRRNNTTLNFPNPNITGILYNNFNANPEDAQKVLGSHEYDDGGKSFNRNSDRAPRSWEVGFDCAGYTHLESKAKTDIFDAFYNQVWFDRTFNFTDKYGETHTGVRIEDYNRSHSAHKSWSQNASFKLVKLP